jgi:hypothetical protein
VCYLLLVLLLATFPAQAAAKHGGKALDGFANLLLAPPRGSFCGPSSSAPALRAQNATQSPLNVLLGFPKTGTSFTGQLIVRAVFHSHEATPPDGLLLHTVRELFV